MRGDCERVLARSTFELENLFAEGRPATCRAVENDSLRHKDSAGHGEVLLKKENVTVLQFPFVLFAVHELLLLEKADMLIPAVKLAQPAERIRFTILAHHAHDFRPPQEYEAGGLIEGNPRLLRHPAQVFHYDRQQWDALLFASRLGCTFRVAGDERTRRAGRWFSRTQHTNPLIDLRLEVVRFNKAVDAKGAEEMTDTFADPSTVSR